jgi:NADPH:quinone reductase-like Zn-dependent oxidoreductase
MADGEQHAGPFGTMKIYDPERTGGKKAPMTLEGKTLFISGGSRGIGLAIALRAARDGANVALIAKTAEPHPKLEGTVYTAAAQIEAAGGHALPVVGDIRDEAQAERAVAQAVERFGGIDVCVNNASAINLSGTEALEIKRYDLMQSINTRGTFVVSRARRTCSAAMRRWPGPAGPNCMPTRPTRCSPGQAGTAPGTRSCARTCWPPRA